MPRKAAQKRKNPEAEATTAAAAAPQSQAPAPTAAAAAPLPSPQQAGAAGAEVSLAALQHVETRKKQLCSQLKDVERQIFDLETRYLQSCNPNANALIGYEGLANQAGGTKAAKGSPVDPVDRIFSNSSTSTRRSAAAAAAAAAAAGAGGGAAAGAGPSAAAGAAT